MVAKLIVLRGNSGSGKSSVARAIQERIVPHPMLIEHDNIRRKILKEKEGPDIINPELVYRTVQFAHENNRDVIVEGILRIEAYRNLFDRLIALYPNSHYFYYFDIPLEETLKRHKTKGKVDFGLEDMKRWYKQHDETGYEGEVIIPKSNSFEDSVNQIILETGLMSPKS